MRSRLSPPTSSGSQSFNLQLCDSPKPNRIQYSAFSTHQKCLVKAHLHHIDAHSSLSGSHQHSLSPKAPPQRCISQNHTEAPQQDCIRRMLLGMVAIHTRECLHTARGCISCQSLGWANLGTRGVRQSITNPRPLHLRGVQLARNSSAIARTPACRGRDLRFL